MYNSTFDCPSGQGIGCKPVNEVLNLIVEKEDGEDLFVADPGAALLLKNQEKKMRRKKPPVTLEERKKLFLLKERSGDPVLIQATVKEQGSK
jgi:hypothetical protein